MAHSSKGWGPRVAGPGSARVAHQHRHEQTQHAGCMLPMTV